MVLVVLDPSGPPSIDLTGQDVLAIRTSPGYAPPFDWVAALFRQAQAVGAAVWLHPELIGRRGPKSPGMRFPQDGQGKLQ